MSINNEQLLLLVSLYEQEKEKLEKDMQELISGFEPDYMLIHYYDVGINFINRELNNLRTVHDRWYNDKEQEQEYISQIKKRMDASDDEMEISFLQQQLSRHLDKLNFLNNKSQSLPLQHSGILEEMLHSLLKGRISRLQLILSKKNDLLLRFSFAKKELRITLPYLAQHIKNRVLHEDDVSELLNLGFVMNEERTKLVLKLHGDHKEILYNTQLVLCKITFRIFHFQEFQEESYITFTEKKITSK